MRLSAPIFRLKKQARTLARTHNIPLHDALNRIAKREGFESWSLLSARFSLDPATVQILDQFSPGDLILLAARPFQGKTTLGLSLIVEAHRKNIKGAFFTLDLTSADVRDRLASLGVEQPIAGEQIVCDTSDDISAPYIIRQLQNASSGMLVVIDYLQILDQRRDKPLLQDQVHMLKAFAQKTGAIVILISQLNRHYNPTQKNIPDLSDVHLPNPIDLGMFSKTCFLSNGEIQLDAAA